MPEAYYNRGVAYILSGDYASGIPDLSRAGEMGLYKAYNLIKRYRDKAANRSGISSKNSHIFLMDCATVS